MLFSGIINSQAQRNVKLSSDTARPARVNLPKPYATPSMGNNSEAEGGADGIHTERAGRLYGKTVCRWPSISAMDLPGAQWRFVCLRIQHETYQCQPGDYGALPAPGRNRYTQWIVAGNG